MTELLMDDRDLSLKTLFATPFCPTCATLYDPSQYDIYEDRACCSNCGTEYRVPAEYRVTHPEEYLEQGVTPTDEAIAISRFRIQARDLAETIGKQTAGASYELYARRFTEACSPLIQALAPDIQQLAMQIALHHGFVEDAEDADLGFGPRICSISGIEEACCHCGRHP